MRAWFVAGAALCASLAAAQVPQAAGGGSSVPCATPMPWRIARVDPEFDLDTAEAVAALRDAMALWEEGTGRTLFAYDPADGFPVRIVYDERQAFTDERSRREAELARERDRLVERAESLRARAGRHDEARSRYDARVRSFEQRLRAHNDAVSSWNAAGGAPPEVADSLASIGGTLERERAELEAERRTLAGEAEALDAEWTELARAEEALAGRLEALAAEFPDVAMEAAEYREAVRRDGERLVSVGREIRVYRFDGSSELRVVLAHELGHALGLGHVEAPGALMRGTREREGETPEASALHAADVELLEETCPPGSG